MSIREHYLEANSGNPVFAAARVAYNLYLGDPNNLVQGYSKEAALEAACSIFPELTEDNKHGVKVMLETAIENRME